MIRSSSVNWFLFFKTVSFDFYHISDDSIAVIISAAMGFAGSRVVLYGSELLNGLIH